MEIDICISYLLFGKLQYENTHNTRSALWAERSFISFDFVKPNRKFCLASTCSRLENHYTDPFQFRWLKGFIYSSCYYHHQIGSINLSHCYHIFPWSCVWDVCYIIFCHVLYIHSGKTGILFSSLLCSLWWVKILGYVMADRISLFVHYTISLSGVPDYFDRNKILSGYDLSHYQVPHCIKSFLLFCLICVYLSQFSILFWIMYLL